MKKKYYVFYYNRTLKKPVMFNSYGTLFLAKTDLWLSKFVGKILTGEDDNRKFWITTAYCGSKKSKSNQQIKSKIPSLGVTVNL